jgi:hypothetical protein
MTIQDKRCQRENQGQQKEETFFGIHVVVAVFISVAV